MSETSNITKIAELVSRDLFAPFHWQRNHITNCNWKCMHPETHKTHFGTHPTDVVWYYDEPYEAKRTYIQADLKSYAVGSLSKSSILTSLKNLIMSVECAPDSAEWRRKYLVDDGIPFRVLGLLFLYNHDGQFDSDFSSLIADAFAGTPFPMNPETKIMIMGPNHIWDLYSIASNIKQLGSETGEIIQAIPFYPEGRIRQFRRLPEGSIPAATIDFLFSDVLLFKMKPVVFDGDYQQLHVYYRGAGNTKEEFLHLFDSFFRYQTIDSATKIVIHHVAPTGASSKTAENFERARNELAAYHAVGRNKLNSLQFETLAFARPGFSETEIGMRMEK